MSFTIARPRFLCRGFREAQSNFIESGSTTPLPEITLGENNWAAEGLKRISRGEPLTRFPVPKPDKLMRDGLDRIKNEKKTPTKPETTARMEAKPTQPSTRPTGVPKPLGKPKKRENTPPTRTSDVRDTQIGKMQKKQSGPHLMFDRNEKNWFQKLFTRTPKTPGNTSQPRETSRQPTTKTIQGKNLGSLTNTVTTSPRRGLFDRLFRRNRSPDSPKPANKPRDVAPTRPREGRPDTTPNTQNTAPKPRLMFDRNEKNWFQKLFTRRPR